MDRRVILEIKSNWVILRVSLNSTRKQHGKLETGSLNNFVNFYFQKTNDMVLKSSFNALKERTGSANLSTVKKN